MRGEGSGCYNTLLSPNYVLGTMQSVGRKRKKKKTYPKADYGLQACVYMQKKETMGNQH